MDWILFIIIIIAIILVFLYIKYKKAINLVKENSVKYQKITKLNKNYNFNKNVKKLIVINHFVRNKTELNNINIKELLINFLETNTNNLTLNLEYVMENEKDYEEYEPKYSKIDDVTPADLIAVTNMKIKNFNFLENRLSKKEKRKPIIKTKLNLTIKYDEPKGKNDYQKTKKYSYKELKEFYNSFKSKEE